MGQFPNYEIFCRKSWKSRADSPASFPARAPGGGGLCGDGRGAPAPQILLPNASLTVAKSSSLILTPSSISLRSTAGSGQGYMVARNLCLMHSKGTYMVIAEKRSASYRLLALVRWPPFPRITLSLAIRKWTRLMRVTNAIWIKSGILLYEWA